jgi:hypothetical protein
MTAHSHDLSQGLIEGTDEVARLQVLRLPDGARQARKIASKMAASLAGYGKALELRADEMAEAWKRVHQIFPMIFVFSDLSDPQHKKDLRELFETIGESRDSISSLKQSAVEARKSVAALGAYSAARDAKDHR